MIISIMMEILANDVITCNIVKATKFIIRLIPKELLINETGQTMLEVIESRLSATPDDPKLNKIHEIASLIYQN
jgi:hypothetical protein